MSRLELSSAKAPPGYYHLGDFFRPLTFLRYCNYIPARSCDVIFHRKSTTFGQRVRVRSRAQLRQGRRQPQRQTIRLQTTDRVLENNNKDKTPKIKWRFVLFVFIIRTKNAGSSIGKTKLSFSGRTEFDRAGMRLFFSLYRAGDSGIKCILSRYTGYC